MNYSLRQSRLFNKCKIVLIANKNALDKSKKILHKFKIKAIPCESLKQSPQHKKFIKSSLLDRKFRGGFWFYASERFFYIDEYMQEYQICNVIHLESDVMLYCSLFEIQNTLLKNYSGLGVTFDSDIRCIPSIVYISSPENITNLTTFMADLSVDNDMYVFNKYRDLAGDSIVKSLPIIHNEYIKSYAINSKRLGDFSNLVEDFSSIFDAAYHGQYLGGIDPRNGSIEPGFINETCVINPSFLEYSWEKDEKNRLIPQWCQLKH